MSSGYKPDGYNSASVYLIADGGQRVVDFVKKTFGADELRRFDTPDGKTMHGELRIGETVVMIADAGGNYPGFPAWLHVYVPDVDATYQEALEAGGSSVQAPARKEGDPDKRGGVKDPAGNTWWISTQMT